MSGYAYYPGCSLLGTGKSYDESVRAVFEALGVPLQELENWNCCGATAYSSIDECTAFALAARNLALAHRRGDPILAPCPNCYLVLTKTQRYLEQYPEIRQRIVQTLERLGLNLGHDVPIRHPLQVLSETPGLEAIRQKIQKPLKGLRVAPYYGCLLARPYPIVEDPWNTTILEDFIRVTGAEVVPYAYRTRCCGGALTGVVREAGLRMVYILLREALRQGAQAVVTTCPLCQFNLEAFQDQALRKNGIQERIPVLYFTQLLGLALGLPPKKLGLHRHLIPFQPQRKALQEAVA